MTVADFLILFPEFEDRTSEETINALMNRAILQNNSFEGLGSSKQDYAIALYTAYLLENEYPKDLIGGKGAIKRIESFNQKIEYAVNNTDAFGLSSNRYGLQLKDFLDAQYLGGIYV